MKKPGKFTLTAHEAYARGRSDARDDREFCELIPTEARTEEARASCSRGYAEAWKQQLAAGAIGGAA